MKKKSLIKDVFKDIPKQSIKKALKKATSFTLAFLMAAASIPTSGLQVLASGSADTGIATYAQDNKVDENDIAYENAIFVNYDSVAWTFINQCIRGTWMYIKSYKNSNMLLQVSPGGADANLWNDGSWYKHWQFEPENDYFYIKNCDTGQYLWFDTLCNGAKLGASNTKGWNNRFQLVTDLRASTFSIRPYADTRYCVDISGRDSSLPQQEDRVQIWEYHGYQNQLWNIHVDNPNLLNNTLIYNVQNNPQGTCPYNYPLSGVVPGMVQDTLDSNSMDNMGLKFNNIYTAYNLFGNVDSSIKFGNLHVYQEVNTDYKFPFKIDSDGYRTFDSANMYVVKNDTNKKFDLYNGGYQTWWHDVTSQYEAAMDNQFIPYNTPDNASNMDYGFTMCMTLKFLMEPDGKVHTYDENGHEIEQSMIFEFTGDDDLWIYIDGNLRLDMGGIHGPKSGTINFDKSAGEGSCVAKVFNDDGAVNTENKFNLPAGEHEMKIFYMERAQKGSNLKIRYNLISKNNLRIDPNGGTYLGSSDVYEEDGLLSNEKIPLRTPVRTGYTFAGWKIEGSGRISSDNKKYFMGVNDTTLVAQWTPNAYNLKFNYNKPDGAHADVADNSVTSKKVYYKTAVGELPQPTLKGYKFKGWQDADGNTYDSDTVYNTLGDTTVYAQWEKRDYTITFDYNCSKTDKITGNSVKSKAAVYGEAVGELPEPSIEGKTFNGWWYKTDKGTNKRYYANTIYDVDGDITLKADWNTKMCTVYYYGNGGTTDGTYEYADMLDYDYEYNSYVEIHENPFSYDGDGDYTFAGWSLTEDGEVKYQPGEYVTLTDDLYLYAVWKKDVSSLRFHANGGSKGIYSDPYTMNISYGDNITMLPDNAYVRTDYILKGWSLSSKAATVDYKCSEKVSIDDYTLIDYEDGIDLYAVWEVSIIRYKITFDYNSPNTKLTMTGNSVKTKDVEGGRAIGTLPVPKISYYTFDGWYTDKAGGTKVTDKTICNGNMTLYAHWTPVEYKITYNLDGGTVKGNNPELYTVETDTFTLVNPVKTGYDFAGWTGTNGTTPEKTVTVTKGSYGDREYKANWTKHNYSKDIYIRYQNEKGGWSDYTKVTTITGAYQSTCSYTWPVNNSNNDMDRYKTVSWKGTCTDDKPVYLDAYRKQYSLRVTGTLNNSEAGRKTDISSWGRFDVYVNGQNISKQTGTCSILVYYEAPYEINNLVCNNGYAYSGRLTGDSTSGTMGAAGINISFDFYNPYNVMYYDGNGNTDGKDYFDIYKVADGLKLSDNRYSKNGYSYAGWKDLGKNTGKTIYPGDLYNKGTSFKSNAVIRNGNRNIIVSENADNFKSGSYAVKVKAVSDASGTINAANKNWSLEYAGNGIYYIHNAKNGKVLTATNETVNGVGNVIKTAGLDNLNTQKFMLETAGNGYYRIKSVTGGYLTQNDSMLNLQNISENSNQKWYIDFEDTTEKVSAVWTDSSILVTYDGNFDSVPDLMDDSNAGDRYMVSYNAAGNDTFRKNEDHFRKLGYVYNSYNSKKDGKGTEYAEDITNIQKSVNADGKGTFIMPASDNGLYVYVMDNKNADATEARITSTAGQNTCKWSIEYVKNDNGTNYYHIRNNNNGKMLADTNGNTVVISGTDSGSGNMWSFEPDGDGNYYIKNNNGSYLTAARVSNGSGLTLNSFSGNKQQKWKLPTAGIYAYVQWKSLSYKINYDGNGVSVKNGVATNMYGGTVNLSDTLQKYKRCYFGEERLEKNMYADSDGNLYDSNGSLVTYVQINAGQPYTFKDTDDADVLSIESFPRRAYAYKGWAVNKNATAAAGQDAGHVVYKEDSSMDALRLFYQYYAYMDLCNTEEFNALTPAGQSVALNNKTNEYIENKKTVYDWTSGETPVITLYAVWDEYPVLAAYNEITIFDTTLLHFSMDKTEDFVNNSLQKTFDESLSDEFTQLLIDRAFIEDKTYDTEDGDYSKMNIELVNPNIAKSAALACAEAAYRRGMVVSTAIWFKMTDSVGNVKYKYTVLYVQPTVNMSSTDMIGGKGGTPVMLFRNIDRHFYNTYSPDRSIYNWDTYKDLGGLMPSSIWYERPDYVAEINACFDSLENDNDYFEVWEFKKRDMPRYREFIENNGWGKTKSKTALREFYDEFAPTNRVSSKRYDNN